ncbi:MAG: Gfo/Idh/MocA family oxidoreductase [Pirellulaceae bacterium]
MSVQVCRWGIVSSASIGRKNWQAIGRSGNGVVHAVSSRSVESANRFIDENMEHYALPTRPKAYGSHEELLNDPDIDAIYVPLPTGLRKDIVIAAAQKGKHVLCEKPCAISAADLDEMIAACNENGVQFMDGVMYMHTERLNEMRKVVDNPEIVGKLKRVATQFSFCHAPDEFFRENIRSDASLEPQGCLGDLGWYTIRFTLWALNGDLPTSVRGRILSSVPSTSGGPDVPTEFSGEMIFENGVSASMYVSFITGHQQWGVVSGTKGLMQVSDFVLPNVGKQLHFETRVSDFNKSGWDFDMVCDRQSMATEEESNMGVNAQETRLFRNFGNIVLEGKPDMFWPDISMKTQLILDALLESGRNDGCDVELKVEMV